MIICQICNRECKNYISLGQHIKSHGYNAEMYYRKFVNDDNKCKICGKPTKFASISAGYKLTCSAKCAGVFGIDKRKETCLEKYGTENPAQNIEIRQKISNTVKSEECQEKTKQTNRERYGTDYATQSDIIKNSYKHITNIELVHETRNKLSDEYEIENNCTRIGKLIQQYGQGWLSIKNTLNITHIHGYTYIDNNDIQKIIDYTYNKSKPELELFEYISSIYNDVLHNTRSIINPYELDIYIPSLKLAIEFNGTWFHSIENGMSKNYHLEKSLLCREKEIRLIHIYEFEDFEKQKQLLKDLFNGIDNYPKNDFNKNNLIKTIPESELIHVNSRGYHVYGAGKLY